MQVPWSNQLNTGIDEIDAEHRELFQRFNLLMQACEQGRGRAELVRLLSFLDDYVETHFANEEKIQEVLGFPYREEHRREHQVFVEKLGELKEKVNAHGAAVHLVVEGARLVAGILFDHISLSDAALAQFIRERQGKGLQYH